MTRILPASQKGDLAIAQAQLAALRERYPGAHITALCRRPSLDAPNFGDADSIDSELFPQDGSSIPRRLLQLAGVLTGLGRSAATRSFGNLLAEADLLVFCGGGSPGGYGFANLVLHAWGPVVMANRAGVPVCFPGLGVHRYRHPLHRWLHRRVLAGADCIAARDPLSAGELERLSLPGRVRQTADWAWLLPVVPREESLRLLAEAGLPASERLRIGINLRSDRAAGPEGVRRKGGPGAVMAEAIADVVARFEADVAVFSMNAPPASDDLAFARRILAALPATCRSRVHLVPDDLAPDRIKGMIACMDLFIGTRLHPSLFAVSSRVPTVTVHDQPKVRGFMQQVGLLRWHLPAAGLSAGRLVEKIVELDAQRGDIRRRLVTVVPEMERAARQNLACVEASLGARASKAAH